VTGYRAFETRFRRRVYRPLPEEVRFAVDSLLEGDGFEPWVPDGAKPKPLAPGNGSSNPALSSGESHKPAGRNSLRVSVRKQTKPRSEVEVAKGSRSLLLCDARISVFHVSDGAAKKSAQAWLIRGGLVDLGVSNVTKFTDFEIIA
jgi:hypothetical protein